MRNFIRTAFSLLILVSSLHGIPMPEPHWLKSHKERLQSLFEAIDLDHHGLESVREAWENNDLEAACKFLLQYYREKDVKGAPFLYNTQSDSPFDINIPRKILNDHFTIQGITARQPRLENGLIDWNHFGPRQDKEWAWLMNRHHYFYQLVSGFHKTGEAAFIKKIDEILQDWVPQNDSPRRLNFTPAWRALEAARRILDSWIWTFYNLQDEPVFSAKARLLLLSSIPDHGEMLNKYSSFWGGNHLLTEKIALAQLAVAFPEFKKHEAWVKEAREKVSSVTMKETYPDGAYKELAFHYHRIVSENLMHFTRLLEYGGYAESNPQLEERVQAMWEYMLKVARPSGFGPLNNDSDLDSIRLPRYLDLLGHKAPEDWLYLVSGGKQGRPPRNKPSRLFEWSGHAIFRQNWNHNAHWAFFDAGPYGTAHQQNDRLHVSISAYEEDFLVDSGRYTYQPGPLRDYFKGPAAHNVILLNGHGTMEGPSEVSRPLPVSWIQTRHYDFAAADHPYPENRGRHHRGVFYRKNGYWLILDEITTFGPREIEAIWHIHPDRKIEELENNTFLIRGDRSSLFFIPVLNENWDMITLTGVEKPTPRGWHSDRFNRRLPSTELVFKHQGSGPRTFAWLILPYPDHKKISPARLPEISIQSLDKGKAHMDIRIPGGSLDTLIISRRQVESFSTRSGVDE